MSHRVQELVATAQAVIGVVIMCVCVQKSCTVTVIHVKTEFVMRQTLVTLVTVVLRSLVQNAIPSPDLTALMWKFVTRNEKAAITPAARSETKYTVSAVADKLLAQLAYKLI